MNTANKNLSTSGSGLRAVFPGTFDPITNGHIDLILRGLSIFDQIIVGVLDNPEKKNIFTVEERLHLIKAEFKDYGQRVIAASFSGLLVEFVNKMQGRAIIRGLRAISDYDYEAQMAIMNKNLDESIETFFMMSSEKNSYISSSLVRQIAQFGGAVTKLVTPNVENAIKAKFKK